jgi:hypothetical protein
MRTNRERPRSALREVAPLLGGMALGASLMYLLDPVRGARRRALLRDGGRRRVRQAGAGIAGVAGDVGRRSRGAVAELLSRYRAEEVVGDDLLEARVRARLGRLVSHPGSIEVVVHGGRVTLVGPVLAEEVAPLLDGVRRVRGVEAVIDELEAHRSGAHVPGLQGGAPRAQGRPRRFTPGGREPRTR